MASQPAPEPIKVSPPPVIARAVPPEQASLAALLQYEAEVRRQPTEAELVYHVANESRRIVAYDQMFVLRHARIGDGYLSYSIFIPRYRFSYTPTGTSTPSPPSCSIPITVTHWLPFAAITHFFSKHQPSLSPPACPSPSLKSHSYTNYLRIPFPGQVPLQPPQATTPPLPPPQASCKVFHTFLATLPSSEQFFLGCHSLPPNLQHFITDIHSNNFSMASDGSVRAPNGSFAWVIYGIASKTHWSGHNTIAKGHSDLSSFRTEACGYLGALYALRAILTAFPLPRNSPPIYSTIHIDNSGVVHRSRDTPFSIQQCLLPDKICQKMQENYEVLFGVATKE